ncbi:MAG: GNAT family N-acetyltransferase [Pedobacter sp.]|uniref:GNAT family N-acetyltransferase n=1 Tax=Pedobacter sp. TaxID=1411316 RepID=UPI00280A011A|nr:GNAT family N-acetyltransferase [Pedobacter sp.]MDQ8004320.1 GNAT family N-acetyltransferase [Pedobacter sp.]
MKNYKCLKHKIYVDAEFQLLPIRDEDKLVILKMRNEQLYHLRQEKPLTVEMQDFYFKSVIGKLFDQEKPEQILFSFLENNCFIGYGGLVHINWIDRHAEISFIMRTELEKDKFSCYWSRFIKLLEKVGFEDLKFHKLFTYAFDLRPHLYPVLENMGFFEDARLKEHCLFQGRYIDVVINSKINGDVEVSES